MICNIDRINLSVAILPMAQQYNWSESRKGLIQSIFFAGYMTTQILGGKLADAHGGRIVLAMGVLVWSICTLIMPFTAPVLWLLLITRIVLGAGEGVAMPAMNSLVAATVPLEERGRSLSFIYSGMFAGSISGLIITPWIITMAGWHVVFYICGGVGIVWVAVFLLTTSDALALPDSMQQKAQEKSMTEGTFTYQAVDPESETAAAEQDEEMNDPTAEWQMEGGEAPTLREIFSKRCVWAIIVAHFCCTWGYFVLLTWLPSFLFSRFKLNLTQSALLSTAPWIAMFIFTNISGAMADLLIRHQVSVTTTRKVMQSIGFLGPALFLTLLTTANDAITAVVYIAFGLAFASFSHSGVYANHQDIGPKIAGTLLGISNTFASIPGLVGVWLSGVVLDATGGNWNWVFAMAIFFYVVGFVVYGIFGISKRQW